MKNETPQKSCTPAPNSVDKAGVAKTHDGTVVSVAGDKLTSTCSQGQEHHHTVAKDAKVTCDGHASKLADLKPGTPIRVTCCQDDKNKLSAIESGKQIHAAAH